MADASVSLATPPVEMISILPVNSISGGTPLQGMERMTAVNFVTPGWFSTFGMRVRAGRDISRPRPHRSPSRRGGQSGIRAQVPARREPARAPDRVNGRTAAGDLVDRNRRRGRGRRVRIAPRTSASHAVSPDGADRLAAAAPPAQADLSVRSGGAPPLQLARSVAAAVHGVNPDMVVTFRSLTDQVGATLAQERIVAMLSGFFGTLALLLAALGLYGVTSYAVSRRRTEIGIRAALGASRGGLVRLVLSRVATLVAAGVVIGAGLSMWASKFVAALLYGLEPRDPATLAGAAIVLAAVGAAAGGLPAYRASRIDPAEVLRDA